MDSRKFQRMLKKAIKRYHLTADGDDHGFTDIMDDLVVECSEKQWQRVLDTFDEIDNPLVECDRCDNKLPENELQQLSFEGVDQLVCETCAGAVERYLERLL